MNNAAAIGYMVLAAKSLRLPKETIDRLEVEMRWQMDMEAEETAERAYNEN